MIVVPKDRIGFVSQAIFEQRLEVCKKCEDLRNEFLCIHCGCHMDSKCQIASSECPIGKWTKEESVVK